MFLSRSLSSAPLVVAIVLSLAASGSATAAIKTSFGDHSLCCGPRGAVGLDGLPVATAPSLGSLNHPMIAVSATASSAATGGSSAVPAAAPSPAANTAASTGGAPQTATAPSPSAPAAPAPAGAPERVEGYLKLGFDRLSSFVFNPAPYDPAKPNDTPPSSADQIPATVKAFDGQKAIVTGFMLPVRTDKGLVTEFLLMRDAMMCCYGVVPNINEWVVVRMNQGGIQALQDVPLAVYGKLHVKEIFENGYLSGIYMLEAEKASPSKS